MNLFATAHMMQTLGTGEVPDVPITKILVSLLLSIGLVILVTVFLKRYRTGAGFSSMLNTVRPAGKNAARRITIIETRRLSQHADICLLESGDTEYLLVVSASQATVLARHSLDSVHEDSRADG